MGNERPDPFLGILAALNDNGVRYLVIAGRACIWYGASEFTRDIDFWVSPEEGNLVRLRAALADVGARPHSLPPLERDYLLRGHGVHFMVPWGDGEIRIDLMGNPPRVGSFDAAMREATWATVQGVRFPVVDVPRLVAMKKTQRKRDEDVIGRLVDLVYAYGEGRAEARQRLCPFLARELRDPEKLKALRWWPDGESCLKESRRPVAEEILRLPADGEEDFARARALLDEEARQWQEADRRYWRVRLEELRALRRKDRGSGA